MPDYIVPKYEARLEKSPVISVEPRTFGGAVPERVDAEISFIQIWQILRRRKRFIATSVVVILALAVAYTLTSTPKYEATSTIEFNLQNSDVTPFDDAHALVGDPNSMSYHVAQETQTRALQSDMLALQVVHELNLDRRVEFTRNQSLMDHFRKFPDESNLPLDKAPHRRANVLRAFHKNLTVKPVPGSRMINVSFLSPDSQLAASVVNTLVKDFDEEQYKIRYAATAQVSDFVTGQLEDLKKQVEASQEKLVQYQKQAGILGTDEAHNMVMTRLEEEDRQLVSAETNRIMAQTVWQLARSGDPELITAFASSSAGSAPAGSPNAMALIQNLRLQQSQLKLEYAQAAAKYGSEYPRLVQLRNELSELDGTIKAQVQDLAIHEQNDFTAAKQTEDAIRASFEKAKFAANKLNDDAIQYSILKQEVESRRSLYDSLSKQLKEAGILAGVHPTNIVTIDPAMPSDRPAKPSNPLNLALGLFAGLMVGLGGAFALENFDETVTTPDQAEQLSLVPALGLVPRSKLLNGKRKSPKLKGPTRSYPSILIASHPHSQVAEAYRSLRTSIMHATRGGQNTVLLFTSALPDEGKTTTSINCAAALAQQGKRVLFVEADMRRPKISSQWGLSGSFGLSSLIGSANPGGLPIKATSIPNLSVIPAGPKPQQPAELLGSPRMAELIKEWRATYDYVVIDSPPILAVTDAVVLAQYCDAAIIVLRSGVTKKQSLLRVRDLFKRSGIRIAGLVINAFDQSSADYSHYFGYQSTAKNLQGYYTSEPN
ncbi:MAG TPA: polysaccharide biosynthesis tyrosine autokinase [Terriglobia bacterium]|nr:polysaccharide biosynthesis tyrosine autokinase [Terriglobia bacterium]